jgi:hypothetical protein
MAKMLGSSEKLRGINMDGPVITNCTFNGVHFDAKTVETVGILGKALLTNAEAVLNISSFLSSQNIRIDTLLSVNSDTNSSQEAEDETD